MDDHQHHEKLIKGLHQQLEPILESSEQAIYAYLDDSHKFCNQKYAKLLGYASADEWAKIDGPFPEMMVEKKSQGTLIEAYSNAMEKRVGSKSHIVWKKKDGGTVESYVILVPIAFEGHLFALHFVLA